MTGEQADNVLQAEEVRGVLDQFEEQNWDRHTPNIFETVEAFARRVVEDGTFMPAATVAAELDLTPKERITGRREQDMTAMIELGMMLGAALERDVPENSEEEELWREGEFVLP